MSRKRGTEMSYEHDIKTLLTIGENIVIEFNKPDELDQLFAEV